MTFYSAQYIVQAIFCRAPWGLFALTWLASSWWTDEWASQCPYHYRSPRILIQLTKLERRLCCWCKASISRDKRCKVSLLIRYSVKFTILNIEHCSSWIDRSFHRFHWNSKTLEQSLSLTKNVGFHTFCYKISLFFIKRIHTLIGNMEFLLFCNSRVDTKIKKYNPTEHLPLSKPD